jgi:hypothetical protein
LSDNAASQMTSKPAGFFEGTEMPTAGWWEALWPDPASGPRTDLRMSPDATITAVESGGLRSKALVDIPPYHYGAVFGRG